MSIDRNGRLTLWQALLIGLVMALLGVISTLATTGVSLHSRVSAAEATITAHAQQFDDLKDDLARMESKLDRLIERTSDGK